MADFYDEFVTYLKAESTVTDEVGATTASRIFPDVPKQATALPFIVIAEAPGGTSSEHLGGITGIAEAAFHVYCYGSTRTAANDLSEVVRLAGPLQTFKGTMGSTAVQAVTASTHRDSGVDQPQNNQDGKRYWNRRTYRIIHTEPTS